MQTKNEERVLHGVIFLLMILLALMIILLGHKVYTVISNGGC